jgi:hypothetical protein
MITDGSSAISETRKSNIQIRDSGVCVFCGDDPVDVAHIVARKGVPGHVAEYFIWSLQGGGGTWIPNQGWEGGGPAKGRKKKCDLANFDGGSSQ